MHEKSCIAVHNAEKFEQCFKIQSFTYLAISITKIDIDFVIILIIPRNYPANYSLHGWSQFFWDIINLIENHKPIIYPKPTYRQHLPLAHIFHFHIFAFFFLLFFQDWYISVHSAKNYAPLFDEKGELPAWIWLCGLRTANQPLYCQIEYLWMYRQISNIRRSLISNKIVDHMDAVGASPVGAAPTTSSFSA